ncbi:MAG: YncE family protein, partial [Alphaproteobacteria bacterium]|nr:YncE family protein [Alphaproteobacteria bacterium]
MIKSVLFAGAAFLAVIAIGAGHAAAESSGVELLPTGQRLTPTAASGAIFESLNPDWKDAPGFRAGMAVTTAVSHDHKTLLILTSGFNEIADASGTKPLHLGEYIFVYDISSHTPRKLQVLTVPNTFSGIVFAPDDRHFYVSGGSDDDVHVFARKNELWHEDGPPIALGHVAANAIPQNPGDRFKPAAAGLDVTADGQRIVVANYNNDSISVIDVAERKKIAEFDLRPGKENPKLHGVPGGEYPLWVQISGHTAYVSAQRDREVDVVDISGAPRLITRIKVQGVPNRMLLNPTHTRLYVASDNADIVSVIDTAQNRVIGTINAEAPPGLIAGKSHFGGAAPNSLALSANGHQLFVTDGGLNAVAIIRLNAEGLGQVAGLVPTGWYPNSVSTAGGMLYIVNGRSDPGPNPQGCTHNNYVPMKAFLCRGNGHYILQLSHAGFLTMPIPDSHDLEQLTDTVAANDDLRSRSNPADDRLMAALRRHIKHVIYIVKENRTYDQILGDLGRGNSDPSLTLFGERVTPNQHALARQFVDLDNFEDSGEVSGEGWPWSTDARETDVGVKTIPMQYAGRISNYDVEGQNRNVNVGVA